MMTPVRVQRRRAEGWRMPENTVYVGRPSKWGNPWGTLNGAIAADVAHDIPSARKVAAEYFEDWLIHGFGADLRSSGPLSWEARDAYQASIEDLHGKNLACWCPEGQPCHADLLLKLANPTQTQALER